MEATGFSFPGPTPTGRRGGIAPGDGLPVDGSTEVGMPVEQMWEAFCDVGRWPAWNPCMWRARVRGGGELRDGETIAWVFNAIKPWYPYKMPARAEIVEFVPNDRVTWEVNVLGFHALHSYRFAAVGPERCRFGSWEVAEGPGFRMTRKFWLAHFHYVNRSSLAGAQMLASGAKA